MRRWGSKGMWNAATPQPDAIARQATHVPVDQVTGDAGSLTLASLHPVWTSDGAPVYGAYSDGVPSPRRAGRP